jgi:hypothetical protein
MSRKSRGALDEGGIASRIIQYEINARAHVEVLKTVEIADVLKAV